jgi:hypothetical protein
MKSALESLSVVRREEWGAGLSAEWPASPDWPPIQHSPQILVVHHTATSNDREGIPVIRQIWQYHARTQGWGDIRYHYLISQDGTIYKGRWSGGRSANIFVEGGQTMVSNTGKIGIVLLGQFESSVSSPAPGEPTPEALESLVKLLAAIAYDQDLDPLGQVHHPIEDKIFSVISGHRDHYPATSCPGSNLYTLLGDIREQVAAEVQRLRDREGEEPVERVISIAPTGTQVAWGKSVWPNLMWGTSYLYSGAWGDVPYHSLIEFRLPEQIGDGQIISLELLLTGKHANYLRETTGTWQATVLEQPLRGHTTAPIPFEALQTARPVAIFSPTLSPGDLGANQENRLVIAPAELTAVQEAAESGYLSIRLAGPEHGHRLFAWDSGQDGRGPLIKIGVQFKPQPSQDMSDLVMKDIAFERIQAEQIRLTALVANIGQAQTAGAVEVAFFVDDQYATSGILEPLPVGASRTVQAPKVLFLSGVHRITAIVDDINSLPEEEKQNNTLTKRIDFGRQPPPLADVIILEIQMGQARLIEGDRVTFQAVVKNTGAGPTGDVVGVVFWVDEQYITFGTWSPLAPGAVQSIRAVSPWQAVAGRHKLVAIVDHVNRFPEQSETNNRFELDFEVFDRTEAGLSDSTVEFVDFETDQTGQITLTATVKNIGNAPTADVVGVGFLVDDQHATYGVTQPMAPGATETVRAVKSLPLQGIHKITAVVDDINRYDEISHQNNQMTRYINFTP